MMEHYSYPGSLAGRTVALGSMLYEESATSATPLDPGLGDAPFGDLSSQGWTSSSSGWKSSRDMVLVRPARSQRAKA